METHRWSIRKVSASMVSDPTEKGVRTTRDLNSLNASHGSVGASNSFPAVSMRNVELAYGDTAVLTGLDVDVLPGERVVFIGRSGSGKTSLLRLVMGLENQNSGDVEVFGNPVGRTHGGRSLFRRGTGRTKPATQHVVGMVFQQFNLFPHMTVLQNVVEAPVRVLGVQSEDARRAAVDLLEKVGIGGKVDSYPAQLSGGQQQRVAIARALAMKPQIMLFDEVTSALDPEMVREVLNVIRKIATETSMTMLLVTHEMGFAREIADRVVYLEEGMVVEDCAPEIIFDSPRDSRTRAFLSSVLNH